MISNTKLKIASISDIHVGNKRNSTQKICNSLVVEFLENPSSKDLDILFICGDFFDGLLDLKDEDLPIIKYVVAKIIMFCAEHDIVLRILEGTPSHDWKQSAIFITLTNILQAAGNIKDIDIRYIDSIEVEYMKRFDINVLYVPDEIMPTPADTLIAVKSAIKAKGLDRVDFAVMHGQFEYQLPSFIKKIPRHDSASYIDLVKHYIFVGHIHKFSVFDKIIAQGSFDRLAHGEEEPKGYVLAIVDEYEKQFFFIENKTAKVYRCFNVKDQTLENTIRDLNKLAESIPEHSAIRIDGPKGHPIFDNMDELIRTYPFITWTKNIQVEDDVDNEVSEQETDFVYEPIIINRDNVASLLKPRIEHALFETDLVNRSMELLGELL